MPDPHKLEQVLLNREANQQREAEFKKWYAAVAKQQGLDPDPDNPLHFYDYRAAHRSGAMPDKDGHWPSEFKREGHPRLIVNGVNTKTGERVIK